jgi:hypothetical protein
MVVTNSLEECRGEEYRRLARCKSDRNRDRRNSKIKTYPSCEADTALNPMENTYKIKPR